MVEYLKLREEVFIRWKFEFSASVATYIAEKNLSFKHA
jgi:hypothetical protein